MRSSFCSATNTNKDIKPSAAERFISAWAESNLFLFRRWDGLLYGLLYIAVPIVLTWVGIKLSVGEPILFANCYFSLVINAANCLYDVFGRWDDNLPMKKAKLIVILLACAIVAVYGMVQLVAVLGVNELSLRNDRILYLYLPAVVVSLIDIFALAAKRGALNKMVNN